jgi:UDP:flavonoid glycosyltransferase YjiC (YdhE family)
MARFLLTVWPLTGHLYTYLPLARSLRERGHAVAIYSGPSAEAVVKREGFEFFPFRRVDGAKLDKVLFTSSDAMWGWRERLDRLARYREWILGNLPEQIEDIDALLAEWKPDILVCDPMLWGPFLVLQEIRPITVAIFVNVPFCLIPSPRYPLPGLGLPLARNWAGRLRNRLTEAVQYRLTAGIRKGANAVRVQYGLPPLTETVSSLAGRVPLYMVTGTRDFDYGRDDVPATVHYVGPCLWSEPAKDSRPPG